MHFTKMHGLGNDYVYVDGFQESIDDPASLARVVSDRHTGIGGDGLILILPPEAGVEADARMRMFNADGSEAEMCGNGIRCVAKYVVDHGISAAKPLRVQTGNGVLSLDYQTNGDGKVALVTVDMGEPILEAAKIPVAIPNVAATARVVDVDGPADACPGEAAAKLMGQAGVEPTLTAVSMGNPHIVVYCSDVAAVPLHTIGPILEKHAWFPRRINVHFVQVHSPTEVTMVHWERGSGATLACGTGACAVAVAGVLTGRTQRTITGHLPGGDLRLEWREADNHVYMTGPAVEVFSGEYHAAAH